MPNRFYKPLIRCYLSQKNLFDRNHARTLAALQSVLLSRCRTEKSSTIRRGTEAVIPAQTRNLLGASPHGGSNPSLSAIQSGYPGPLRAPGDFARGKRPGSHQRGVSRLASAPQIQRNSLLANFPVSFSSPEFAPKSSAPKFANIPQSDHHWRLSAKSGQFITPKNENNP